MKYTLKLIFIILSCISCEHQPRVKTEKYYTKQYNLIVDQILFENKLEVNNILDINLFNKISQLFNNRKFIPQSGNKLMKINLEKAELKIQNNEPYSYDTYNINIAIKIEIFDEKDMLFPSVEAYYHISDYKPLAIKTSLTERIKFVDNLIDDSILKLDKEIDNNFEENFSSFIATNR